VILAVILTNEEYVGGILKLVEEKRGKQKSFEYVSSSRVMLQYELPLNEIVLDFYDRLKSVSRGYASLDYHLSGNWTSPMAKLDIMVAGEPVDALSTIIHRDFAYERGRALAAKMKQLIPRQMFEVAIQAAIGAKIIARETVPAIRKNVTGQVLRRRHHAQAQAAGKAEGRQEADEAHRARGHSAGSVSGGAEGGRGQRLGPIKSPDSCPAGTNRDASEPLRMRSTAFRFMCKSHIL
jgi:GTP-binding protein LepA